MLTLTRKSIVVAISAVACVAGHNSLPAPTNGVAFVNAAAPALRSFSTRSGMLSQEPSSLGIEMMACRRNLKKEKRARNEACARQYRKAPVSKFARGNKSGGQGRAAQDRDSDELWLSQIYGQHSIYRKDHAGSPMASNENADGVPEQASKTSAEATDGDISPAKELVTA